MLDDVARWAVILLPFSFLAKTITSLVTTVVLARQGSRYDLGWEIYLSFVALTGSGVGLALLFGMLAWDFHHSGSLARYLIPILLVEVFTWGVVHRQIRMVLIQRRGPQLRNQEGT